jgi:REP element-mobilizing transposase RayT
MNDDTIVSRLFLHLILTTKGREKVLFQERREDLYREIWHIHRNLGCRLICVSGSEEHIHILVGFKPTISFDEYAKAVQSAAAAWIAAEAIFPQFAGWHEDYAAFSVSEEDCDMVSDYIKADGERHRTVPFLDEYKQLLTEQGIEFDEREL